MSIEGSIVVTCLYARRLRVAAPGDTWRELDSIRQRVNRLSEDTLADGDYEVEPARHRHMAIWLS